MLSLLPLRVYKRGGLAKLWRPHRSLKPLFEDVPEVRPSVMGLSPLSMSWFCSPRRRSPRPSPFLQRCLKTLHLEMFLHLLPSVIYKLLARSWRLMQHCSQRMHLWWTLLLLQLKLPMNSVLFCCWVWQAHKSALCVWFSFSDPWICNNVGLELLCAFGTLTLCVICMGDLVMLFLYE